MPILILPFTKNKTKGQPPQMILLKGYLRGLQDLELQTWGSVFHALQTKYQNAMLYEPQSRVQDAPGYLLPRKGLPHSLWSLHQLEKGWWWWSASEALIESLNLLKCSFCRAKGSRGLEVEGFHGACTARTIQRRALQIQSSATLSLQQGAFCSDWNQHRDTKPDNRQESERFWSTHP